MYIVAVNKTFEDSTGESVEYAFSAAAYTEAAAVQYACAYASCIEYGLLAEAWMPGEMLFSREQLTQFIQPQTLAQMEALYPDTVAVAYQNAIAYINSYCGNMFNIEAMLTSGDASATAVTLRLALVLSTALFILASVPQYADVTKQWQDNLHILLKGLKSGQRNFGKPAIVADPNARLQIVSLSKTGQKP